MSMVTAGDVVRLRASDNSSLANFDGLLVRIDALFQSHGGHLRLECIPLSDRPDGGLRGQFTWLPDLVGGRGFERVEFPDLTDLGEVEAWLRTA